MNTNLHQDQRRRATMLGGALVIMVLLGWLQWRSFASSEDTYDVAQRQLLQMREDAAIIRTLRAAPQAAAGRARSTQELLAQVERSLSAAGIDKSKWRDSVPLPAVRLPDQDYRRVSTRLYFDGVNLKQLATFSHHLRASDPTLQVSSISLTNRQPECTEFDVEVAVSYLVYSPVEKGATGTGRT